MCTTNGELFFIFTKHTWIDDLGTFCHVSNNNTAIYDITDIDESMQGGTGNVKATKRDNFV